MKETRQIMGMPITVEVLDSTDASLLEKVFAYFGEIDERFSTYKPQSEISKINCGEIKPEQYSSEMREVLALAEQTKQQSNGYFDIRKPGQARQEIDPSGLVKGWAIFNAARLLSGAGAKDYYIDAGGDIQAGKPEDAAQGWRVGIQNPFKAGEIVKVVQLRNQGMATSGSYNRGQHIYNPKDPGAALKEIVSITVIGPNVYEADRFATAAFAMGEQGVHYIEQMPGLEAYQINAKGIATATSGFAKYVIS